MTRSDDDAVTFAPRLGHALKTWGINMGATQATPPVMGEATQLHVMFLVQGQLQLLDCQAVIMLRRKSKRQQKSCWVRSWHSSERRLLYGHYDRLMRELRVEYKASFFNFLRMPPGMFDELLARIGPRIQKQDTRYRKALEPGLKLAVTIKHRLPLSFGGIVDANTATIAEQNDNAQNTTRFLYNRGPIF